MPVTFTDEELESKFGEAHDIVRFYLKDYNKVEELDEKLGDTAARGNAFMKSVAEQHNDAVAVANAIIEQLNALDDVQRAVAVHTIVNDRDSRKHLKEFVEKNQPAETEQTATDAEIAQIWNDRSAACKRAGNLHNMLSMGTITEEQLALLPAPPQGKRGAAPGKRGAMGRKLPKTVSWTIGDEEVGVKSGPDAAKIIGVKTSDLRLAIENAYPDSTPVEFKVTINGKQVFGSIVNGDDSAPEDTLDESEDSDEDFEIEEDFDLDDED
jgi:hypothetical protein